MASSGLLAWVMVSKFQDHLPLYQQTKELLAQLQQWLELTLAQSAEGALSTAIRYSLRRWAALSRYADTGYLPIDNNPVENISRIIALGKKNGVFVGSERAGKRAAATQSLLATDSLNGIEPYAWLKYTLEKLPHWPNSRMDELLPIRR
jgi:transposase